MFPKPLDILTFGSITLDIILPIPEDTSIEVDLEKFAWCIPMGDKIHLQESFFALGGGAANTATGFAKLNFEVGVQGVMGDGVHKAMMLKTFEDLGIMADRIVLDQNAASHFSVILNSFTGHRTVLHQGNNLVCFPKGYIAEAPDAKALYTSHLYESSEHVLWEIGDWKKRTGGLWAFNPGKTQFKKDLDHYADVLPHLDILILNREEAESFADVPAEKLSFACGDIPEDRVGTYIEQPNDKCPDELYDVRKVVQRFFDYGVQQVIVTDGDRGAQSITPESHFFVAPLDVPRVDTLGAGDAFSVGVIGARLAGKSEKDQLLWGTRNACSVLSAHGAGNGQLDRNSISD